MADVTGKKRKSKEDHGSQKKKTKVTPASSTASKSAKVINVSSVVQSKVSPPVIGTFACACYSWKFLILTTQTATAPGIAVAKDAVFNSYSKRPSAKRSRHRSNDLLLHSTSHRTLDYTAREDKPENGQPLLKHYIGLFDPATGKLQLVEGKKMVVRGVVRAQQATDEDMRSQQMPQVHFSRPNYQGHYSDTLQTMLDQRTELGQTFGTKKAKKALEAVTLNAIGPRKTPGAEPKDLNTSEMALMASIKDVTMSVPTQQDLQAAVDANKPVPKGNYDAEEIQDVYKPEELIGRDILELIPVSDWAQAVKKNEKVELRSRFVANRMQRIGSGENAVARLRLLRYLYFLQRFLATARKGRDKGTQEILKKDKLAEELEPAPPPVIESIRRKFSDKGLIRKQHVDLLTTTMCALSCIIDNFETNTWDLKEDLKLEQRAMSQYFFEIGARVMKRKGEEKGRTNFTAVLKLPLLFPKLRIARK